MRIDPKTAKVTGRVSLGSGFSVAQEGFGSVWVANFSGSGIARVDPSKVAGESIRGGG
jgi:streptogramin lyase